MPQQTSETKDMTAKMDANAASEEKEQQKRQIDDKEVGELFSRLNTEAKKRSDDAKTKAAELAKVPVKDEDVDIVAREMGVSKEVAKTKLQEKKVD